MKQANLLLTKARQPPERPRDGKVVTLKSNRRWCTDMFEIRAWSGEKVYVLFAMDCCDREILSYAAEPRHLDGADVRDLMAKAVEARFDDVRTPHPVEWLSDNGPPYTASETRKFDRDTGLLVRTTPSYSPESNGMAEAFVKTFKRDYVYVNDVRDAASIIRSLESYFADYNEHASPQRAQDAFPADDSPRKSKLNHLSGLTGQLHRARLIVKRFSQKTINPLAA